MEKQKKSPDSGKKNSDVKLKSKSPDYAEENVSQHEVQYLTRCTRFRLSTEYELSICNCKHIMRMTIGERHSVVNPRRWLCNICYTTESVWACLSCPNVACGRYIHEHALNHYLESHHPLVIDVNELCVYCYECEEYVLNDNKSGDLKVLRETLQAIRYQNFTGTTRSGHTLRTATISAEEDVQMRRRLQQQQLDRDDRNFTAIWHSRFVRQRKTFRRWLHYIRHKKEYNTDDDNESTSANTPKLIRESEPAPCAPQALCSTTEETKSPIKLSPAVKIYTVAIPPPSVLSRKLLKVEIDSSTSAAIACKKPCATDTSKATEITVHKLTASKTEALPSPTADEKRLTNPLSPTLHKKPIPTVNSSKVTVTRTVGTNDCSSTKGLVTTAQGEDILSNLSDNETSDADPMLDKTIESNSKNSPGEKYAKISKTFQFSFSSSNKSATDSLKTKTDVVILLSDEDFLASEDHESLAEKCSKDVLANIKPNSLTTHNSNELPAIHKTKQLKNNGNEEVTVLEESLKPDDPVNAKIGEGQRRSKRTNAASRYKEIMTRLSLPMLMAEPPAKKPRLSEPEPISKDLDSLISPKRRSLRLIEANKAAELVRRKKKSKSRKKSTKRLRPKNDQISRARKPRPRKEVAIRTLPSRKTRMRSFSKSLYDSVPNRAVTSLIPGVTGLRNLGNTCYLNSIIQVLGHLQKFRRCLLAVRDLEIEDKSDEPQTSPTKVLRFSGRRSTVEMYENQTNVSRRLLRMQAGLNGGRETGSPDKNIESTFNPQQRLYNNSPQPNSLSLCHELHDLYHIMWSGKWKLVSPCHFLSSVWQLIPSFRGYSQQDAQEFLCELLDKIVSELERRRRSQSNKADRLAARISRVVHTVFEGRLHSQVRCLECDHISSTFEPFWDLSLEFPQRYHSATSNSWKNTQGCSLSEMLDKFTEAERLDGGRVYNCSHCNGLHLPQPTNDAARRRRLSSRKTAHKLSEAEKQIKIVELPQILRFHLKRFRWSGRNHREKIIVPVNFPAELDMKPHCWLDDDASHDENSFIYDLSAVVIHHGRGFGSGHYTAYCWNDIGKFWVHCNDSNLELCSIDDVMAAQAYILFYSQRGLDPHPHLFTPPPTPDLSPPISPVELIDIPEGEKFPDHVFEESENG